MEWFTTESINQFFVHNPIFTISIGISAVIATLVYLASFSEVIRKEMKRRRMMSRINHMKDHYILCGFGRVGQQVAKELAAEGELFVILEKDEEKLKLAKEHNWVFITGDVALDETLYQKAHIEHAKAVIIAVGVDADTIFMAISARSLKPDIFLVARASSLEAADKLNKVGVNRVALPYQIGGYHMATMALRPTVVDFLDTLVDHEKEELEMEEYMVYEKSELDGKTIEAAAFMHEGLAILAIRRKDGKAVINPTSSTKLLGGDRLVVMGPQKDLADLGKDVTKRQAKEIEQAEKVAIARATVSLDIKASPFQKDE